MNPAFPSALPRLCIAALLLTLLASHVNAQTPEHARILAASNRTMSATLTLTPGKPPLEIQDLPAKRTLTLPQLFTITLANGSTLRSSDLHPDGNPTAISNPTEKHLCANSDDLTSGAHFHWCLLVPANGSYMRAQLSIHAGARELPIAQVHLLQFEDLQAHVVGTVKGSPAADDSMYFAFEHPLSVTTVDHGAVDASISRVLPLQANQEVTYSAVIGAYSPGQLRRDFLAYIERERPRPYKPFLNYNTWYDIGYENRYSESGALDRIHAFGTELVEKRHVQLDSFVFDDGWDDPTSFWGFNHDLPDGFTRIAQQAATYNAGIGVWLSPWGGYADQKRERIANGKSLGYEIIASGFALSGPKYFHDFSTICSTMIQKYNVNAFKIDGTGNADRVFPGSVFDSDFDAAIHLIHQIRAEKPGIFMNLSTGTYPSPFWLFYSDTIWRGGDDHDFAGVGSQRQRWITYRDEQTYRNVVQTGPLFPLNSLMLHGMIFAQQAEDLGTDPHRRFPRAKSSPFSVAAHSCRKCTSRHPSSPPPTGTSSPKPLAGPATTPPFSRIFTGSAAIPASCKFMDGPRGARTAGSSPSAILPHSHRRSTSTSLPPLSSPRNSAAPSPSRSPSRPPSPRCTGTPIKTAPSPSSPSKFASSNLPARPNSPHAETSEPTAHFRTPPSTSEQLQPSPVPATSQNPATSPRPSSTDPRRYNC